MYQERTLHLLFGPTYHPTINFFKYNWKRWNICSLETRGIIMSDFIYLFIYFLGGWGGGVWSQLFHLHSYFMLQLDFTWAWWFLDANAIRGIQDSSKYLLVRPQCFSLYPLNYRFQIGQLELTLVSHTHSTIKFIIIIIIIIVLCISLKLMAINIKVHNNNNNNMYLSQALGES
jgi:hypothetical protein